MNKSLKADKKGTILRTTESEQTSYAKHYWSHSEDSEKNNETSEIL